MATTTIKIPFSLGPTLSEEQARQVVELGNGAAVWAMLELARMLAEKQTPAADSSDTPSTPYSARDWNTQYIDSQGRKRRDETSPYAHIGVATLQNVRTVPSNCGVEAANMEE